MGTCEIRRGAQNAEIEPGLFRAACQMMLAAWQETLQKWVFGTPPIVSSEVCHIERNTGAFPVWSRDISQHLDPS
jgi:hypothetical protein